mgnify:CR=1 FL=1
MEIQSWIWISTNGGHFAIVLKRITPEPTWPMIMKLCMRKLPSMDLRVKNHKINFLDFCHQSYKKIAKSNRNFTISFALVSWGEAWKIASEASKSQKHASVRGFYMFAHCAPPEESTWNQEKSALRVHMKVLKTKVRHPSMEHKRNWREKTICSLHNVSTSR